MLSCGLSRPRVGLLACCQRSQLVDFHSSTEKEHPTCNEIRKIDYNYLNSPRLHRGSNTGVVLHDVFLRSITIPCLTVLL